MVVDSGAPQPIFADETSALRCFPKQRAWRFGTSGVTRTLTSFQISASRTSSGPQRAGPQRGGPRGAALLRRLGVRARIGQHVGPPLLRRRLLRVRPNAALDGITGFHHGGHQPRNVGRAGFSNMKFIAAVMRQWFLSDWGRCNSLGAARTPDCRDGGDASIPAYGYSRICRYTRHSRKKSLVLRRQAG